MSVKIMAKVWEMDLPPNEKFVLLALADHADHEGNNAYPGQGTLAFKTGYDARNIRRILQSLERQKIVIKTHKGHGKDNPDCYSIRTNKADILSGNKADILSGNKADNMSANDENNADKSNKQSGHIVQTKRTNRAIPPHPPIRRTIHEPLVNHEEREGAHARDFAWLENSAIEMYRKAFLPERPLAIFTQEKIVSIVTDFKKWEAVIEYWQTNNYRPESVGKMLDRYSDPKVKSQGEKEKREYVSCG